MIYMVDFGLSTPFVGDKGQHVLYSNEKKIVGTLRWILLLLKMFHGGR